MQILFESLLIVTVQQYELLLSKVEDRNTCENLASDWHAITACISYSFYVELDAAQQATVREQSSPRKFCCISTGGMPMRCNFATENFTLQIAISLISVLSECLQTKLPQSHNAAHYFEGTKMDSCPRSKLIRPDKTCVLIIDNTDEYDSGKQRDHICC